MANIPRPSWLPRAMRWTGITVIVLLVLALISPTGLVRPFVRRTPPCEHVVSLN